MLEEISVAAQFEQARDAWSTLDNERWAVRKMFMRHVKAVLDPVFDAHRKITDSRLEHTYHATSEGADDWLSIEKTRYGGVGGKFDDQAGIAVLLAPFDESEYEVFLVLGVYNGHTRQKPDKANGLSLGILRQHTFQEIVDTITKGVTKQLFAPGGIDFSADAEGVKSTWLKLAAS